MTTETDLERYTFASQLAVLRNCPVVMTRLMKSGSSYLLIAKVLVISRLLHKALSQSMSKPPIVDQLWERLLSVRRKLLRRIDKCLASTTGDTSTLVESMCAYALATSSTPTDVLQHFHKIRMEKITASLQHGDELAKHGISALRLCIQTCQDTQAIFPRRLAESLAKLKSLPLVKDSEVRGLYELNLDVHDRWIGDEARNYTPWPRHDELQRSEAERILHQWSRQAIAAFLKGIKTALGKDDRLKEVASLRQELIETWILSGSRMAGVKSANVLDDLRDTINSHLESIIRSRTQYLENVVSELTRMLESGTSAKAHTSLSLWSTVPKPADLSNGAQAFKSRILNTHQGRDASVIDIVSTFDKWMDSVLEVKSIAKSMKEARWDDTFADDVGDDDDDDFGDSKQILLSHDDPRLLEEVTQEALSEALKNLGKSFNQIVQHLAGASEDGGVQQACFVLRVMREIGERIPKLRLQDKATPLATPFTTELSKPLHGALGRQIVQPSTKAYKKSLAAATKASSKSHILWEGNPVLPAQPTPSAFRFLQDLNKSMAGYGSDLWAPSGVKVLKTLACEQLPPVLMENMDAISKIGSEKPTQEIKDDADAEAQPKLNGETDTTHPSPATAMQDLKDQKLKQALFDMLYIHRFVGEAGKSDDAIERLARSMAAENSLDESSMARLRKNAADYAKKTYLLFALLA